MAVVSRALLIDSVLAALPEFDPETVRGIRRTLTRCVDEAGPDALAALNERLARVGSDWCYYPKDPLASRIHELLAPRVLGPDSKLLGHEHLRSVAGRAVVIVANHLSYADANLLEVLIRQSGNAALADRLTVIAGPKVYSSLRRRFSSLCFATVKTPQNSGRSTEDAVMTPREVARAARRSIDTARDRLREGAALLVFGEGTRSRTGRMQRMLPGAARYFEESSAWVLPMGIAGTEALFPIGSERLRQSEIVVRVGRPFKAGTLTRNAGRDRRRAMDSLGLAVAALVPLTYRGAYASGNGSKRARDLLPLCTIDGTRPGAHDSGYQSVGAEDEDHTDDLPELERWTRLSRLA